MIYQHVKNNSQTVIMN